MVQKMGVTKKLIKFEKMSGKYDILTVEENRISIIVKKTKLSLAINLKQREIEARQSKVSKMKIKKRIDIEK